MNTYDFDENLTYQDMINLLEYEYNFTRPVMDEIIRYTYPIAKVLRNLNDLDEVMLFAIDYPIEDINHLSTLDIREIKYEIIKKIILTLAKDLHEDVPYDLDDDNINEGYAHRIYQFNTSENYNISNFLYTFWIDNPTREDIQNIAYLTNNENFEISDDVYYTLEKLSIRPFFNPQYTSLTQIDEYINELPSRGSMLPSFDVNEGDWVTVVRFMYNSIFNQDFFPPVTRIRYFNNFIRCFTYYQLFSNISEITQESILSKISTYTQDNNYFSEQFLDDVYIDSMYVEILNVNNVFVVKNYQSIVTKTYSISSEMDEFIRDKIEVNFESRDYEYVADTIIKIIDVLITTNENNNLFRYFNVNNLEEFILKIYDLIVSKIINLENIRYIDILLSIIDFIIFTKFQTSYNNIRNLYLEVYGNFGIEEDDEYIGEIIYQKNGGETSIGQTINPECNVSNEFEYEEDKKYPIDPVTLEKIPRKRLVSINVDIDKTRCYDANTLLNHWKSESENRKPASDPLTRLKFDKDSIEYVQNLLLNNLSPSDETDYYYL
jgi:uncharacterized protein YebE (UPF0316 family)